LKIAGIAFIATLLLTAGCAHQVTFDKPESYVVAGSKQNVGVTAVIDPATLSNKVAIRSFMTGIAHSWEAEPGDMLKQVADIELPQMFAQYQVAPAYAEPAPGPRWVVLELTIPAYAFEDFHAIVSVKATAYERGRKVLLQKTYRAEGEAQGAKMFWAGAFGMKSAIRQSSLDAFRKVFAELRADLGAALSK
jgi:hypothetical protein